MSRTKGTYTLTSNIEPKVGAPLDARTIVKLLADLTANNTFEYPYKGMRVFVEENNKSYTLVGSDPTVSTNWIEDNSGGHTIKNPAGTAMTQRSNLQFVDLTISDDSTNDATKVENIHVIQSESELTNLPDGLYMLDDDEGTVIDSNLVGYDNTDSELNAENVQDAIDEIIGSLGTAATKDIPATGNAGLTEVVMGNDTRLSDARTPVSHTHTTSDISGLGTAATANTTNSISQGGTDVPTAGAVWSAIDNLPEPMILKGTLGTGGTITSLPTAAADNEGFTYKVITAGTYAGQAAKVGDFFVSCKPVGASAYEWVWFPSGDESFTDTWRNIKVNGTELLGNGISTGAVNFKSGSNVTISGSGNDITISAQDTTYSKATAQADGLMSKEDFSKLSGIETGAQVNTITGVKGNAESSYRTGNVNITPTNIGLGNVDNTSDSTKKTNFTGSIASGNTGFTTGGDVYTALQGKVNTETGKGLSTNDYTTAEKDKLSGIESGAEVNQNAFGTINISGASSIVADSESDAFMIIPSGRINIGVSGKGMTITTSATKTEASETNGNIKINSVETPVYRNYGNNTVLSTDKTPYLNRQCLTPTGFSSYVREKLIGCSVAWNQLVQNGDFADTSGWTASNSTFTVSGNVATIARVSTSGASYIRRTVSKIAGHKYFFSITAKHNSSNIHNILVRWYKSGSSGDQIDLVSNVALTSSYQTFKGIIMADSGNVDGDVIIYNVSNDTDSNNIKDFYIIDLTLAFGSSVADTLYAMTNNGGIDWLHNHNYPIDQYTQYGYGLYSSKPSAKKVVGFNVWDEEWEAGGINVSTGANETDNRIRSKNPIPVLPNMSYYCKDVAWVLEYDASGNYLGIYVGGNTVFTTSANTRYLKFKSGSGITTYANNITVNISDTNKNGQYAPYSCTTYSLGNTELRGHLIVQNGEIVAEGDVRESNGEVTRKYGIVDLGTLTWNYSSAGFFYANDLPSNTVKNTLNCLCAKYARTSDMNGQSLSTEDKTFAVFPSYWFDNTKTKSVTIRDTSYGSDATAFKTAMSGVYLLYPLATPTTETSSPFADPMSLNGCTTEEYVDDRTIPVPVGHETQYMGQSEDVVEIPSGSLSDGKRKFVAETSGGKTQYYWEDEISDKPKKTTTINLAAYSSSLNRFEVPCDGYIMARVEPGEGAFSMNLSDYYEELLDAKVVYSPEHNTYFSFYVKKGMKYYYANSQGLTVSIAFRGIT